MQPADLIFAITSHGSRYFRPLRIANSQVKKSNIILLNEKDKIKLNEKLTVNQSRINNLAAEQLAASKVNKMAGI
ncbi:hypothetical protein [Alkalihalobacillus pseudalcaliphilus]|uniref:hypothetical protein n=1 Tax=Alkalihalobacillus pseudalcaliphilus TaxID=79884 RepID=UPI00064D8CBB|nr:hypothetical protein [Alkalihalobacillus pseudalcaliphilus]KMK76148.1 hypothetical protein AB990_13060 [Alkalihalobacillus pseudalcaliphilus]